MSCRQDTNHGFRAVQRHRDNVCRSVVTVALVRKPPATCFRPTVVQVAAAEQISSIDMLANNALMPKIGAGLTGRRDRQQATRRSKETVSYRTAGASVTDRPISSSASTPRPFTASACAERRATKEGPRRDTISVDDHRKGAWPRSRRTGKKARPGGARPGELRPHAVIVNFPTPAAVR